jgi:Na+/H+ antiporter NhaD/arsenite permease-like protein
VSLVLLVGSIRAWLLNWFGRPHPLLGFCSFSASLAGLLWKSILAQKGIQVGRWEFAKNNAVIVLVCMVVGCLVVAAEVCVMYDD